MNLGGARFPQQLHKLLGGGAAHDGAVAGARRACRPRVGNWFSLMPRLPFPQLIELGWMKVRPMYLFFKKPMP